MFVTGDLARSVKIIRGNPALLPRKAGGEGSQDLGQEDNWEDNPTCRAGRIFNNRQRARIGCGWFSNAGKTKSPFAPQKDVVSRGERRQNAEIVFIPFLIPGASRIMVGVGKRLRFWKWLWRACFRTLQVSLREILSAQAAEQRSTNRTTKKLPGCHGIPLFRLISL